MKRSRRGWTLIEVMVSTAILISLLALIAQSIGTAQRSWLSTRSASTMTHTADEAQSALRSIREATLQPRLRYDTALDQLLPESDLHFVCGPANELLPAMPGTCGDAIFFQCPTHDGTLQNALQACGFFIQYGDDDAWRPAHLGSITRRLRFRLFRFHHTASELPIFQPPQFSQIKLRKDLYAWFARPLAAPALSSQHTFAVAENVIAMLVQAFPSDQRCYDTRRQQWEGATAAAQTSRHRLPQSIEITLVIADEASWSRHDAIQLGPLAKEIIRMTSQDFQSPGDITKLQTFLEHRDIKTRLAMLTIPLVH